MIPGGGVLIDAYERFHSTGPEWGPDQLTNHGPMAVEVLIRRGRPEVVPGWVDGYIRRLDELPRGTAAITEATWRDALGDGRRVGDWSTYFARQLGEQPWRDVLATWWRRLLPGIAAGATHGVIRTGHVVRALLAGAENQPTLDELAHALAFWAARSRSIPPSAAPAGQLDPLAALDGIPRIASQQGNLATRFGQLTPASGWPASWACSGRPGRRMRSVRASATWSRPRRCATSATGTVSRCCWYTPPPPPTRYCTPCPRCPATSGNPA